MYISMWKVHNKADYITQRGGSPDFAYTLDWSHVICAKFEVACKFICAKIGSFSMNCHSVLCFSVPNSQSKIMHSYLSTGTKSIRHDNTWHSSFVKQLLPQLARRVNNTTVSVNHCQVLQVEFVGWIIDTRCMRQTCYCSDNCPPLNNW